MSKAAVWACALLMYSRENKGHFHKTDSAGKGAKHGGSVLAWMGARAVTPRTWRRHPAALRWRLRALRSGPARHSLPVRFWAATWGRTACTNDAAS